MTASELALQIYYDTLVFLKDRGYISNINKLLEEESIDDRMTRADVSSAGLDTIDAINCILDRNRTFVLMEEIEKAIKPQEVVVEAGVGTGVLAVFAAALGAEVYGIEINEKTFKLARDIFRMFTRKGLLDEENLNLVMADASKWKPSKRIDLIISENIYTGMFYEMQIPIVNHLLEFISSSGRVIPDSMKSYLILAEAERPLEKVHGELFSATQAEGLVYKSRELSNPVLYDEIYFKRKNDIYCQVDQKISLKRSGLVNALLIYSPVTIAKNVVLEREDMIFMGDDVFIAIDPPLRVSEGSKTRLRMAYKRGGKPEDGEYYLEVL
jgi:type I protein arginine methyltransferase